MINIDGNLDTYLNETINKFSHILISTINVPYVYHWFLDKTQYDGIKPFILGLLIIVVLVWTIFGSLAYFSTTSLLKCLDGCLYLSNRSAVFMRFFSLFVSKIFQGVNF